MLKQITKSMLQCMFLKKPCLDLLPMRNVLWKDFKMKDSYYRLIS